MMLISLFFISWTGFAHEDHDGKLRSEALVKKESFELPKGGRAVLVLRNDGHAMGNEFVLEVRPDCRAKPTKDIDSLKVVNVRSGCKMDEKSLSFDAKKEEVSILVYGPDADDYNRQTMVDPAKAQMKCLAKSFKATMSLKGLCPQK